MIDEKNEKPRKATKLLRVYPKAFAVDEKLRQSLVIFEDSKGKNNFSVTLGAAEEVSGLVKDSSQSLKGPYSFSGKLLEAFEAQPKKAIIKSEGEVDLCLKQEEVRGFKRVKTGFSEMLGLWSMYDFPIYSKPEFIESIREVDLNTNQKKSAAPNANLYKVYGQKYLM